MRRDGGWLWRLVDFFSAVVGQSPRAQRSKKAALKSGHEAAHRFAADMKVQIASRKARITSRMESKPWPSDWKRMVREHDKLGKMEKKL